MLTSADIAHILPHYDLGDLRRVTQAPHGYVNETAFVETRRGRFVVRRNHRRFSAAAHRYRHLLIARLCTCGVPAPALIAARDGATLLLLDGRWYEVQVYVAGEDYDPDRPQQLRSVGATLARYHRAVAGFAPPPRQTPPRYHARGLLALIEQILERDVMGDLHEPLVWYGERAGQLRARLTEDTYAALPHAIIHGDIHSDNFRFAGDRVVALLDYDQVAWDARLVDLADALVAFATLPQPDRYYWGVYQGPLDEDRAAALVAAYDEIAPLTSIEVGALPALVEILWLRGELARVRSTPEGAPDYHQALLEQGRMLSEWMEEHAAPLMRAWSALPLERRFQRSRSLPSTLA